jgi:chemotaxis protein methyltransferase CheR
MSNLATELNSEHFNKVCGLVYRFSGIHLKEGKEALVKTRLMKRLRALNLQNFDTYLDFIESDAGKSEIGLMIDVMTTNQTSFFREGAHFSFIKNRILPKYQGEKLRIWSAACSSGQEPYSIAMLLRENMPDIEYRDIRILATDISQNMLKRANMGVFSQDQLNGVPENMIKKYFSRYSDKPPLTYKIKDNIKTLVSLAWLNLLESWPMKGPFDIIFCRNVMIYFDRPTQQKLVQRFWELLSPGGYLFVGHSEGLAAVSHKYQYVQPAVYRK